MYPSYDISILNHRVERLTNSANQRRMARSARAEAMPRSDLSLRGALGNGLIALGERLAEPPSDNPKSLDQAA